jgi:dinuclear metal center YbgI/SA1388 family protein
LTAADRDVARWLDEYLGIAGHPDYEGALNGLQVECRGPVRRIAAAVDASHRTIRGAADRDANLLIVHHGLFWGGAQRVTGPVYARLRLLMEADMAVYAAHLPLDSHPEAGNNVLLARALGLAPTRPFAEFHGVSVGVAGDSDLPTADLIATAGAIARTHGGEVRSSAVEPGRRTTRWAICTGAGASSQTLREAAALGVDTLIVGEGPHHTAVEAPEHGVVIVYAGHYATETLGVRAVAERAAAAFGLPWEFVDAPTGL